MPDGKKPKIKFADGTAIEALWPYAEDVLRILSEVLDDSGVARAWVSDLSSVADLMPSHDTGEREYDETMKMDVHIVTQDTKENRQALEQLTKKFGMPVQFDTRIYELAVKLRDTKAA